MELTRTLQRQSGLDWVLDRLDLCSPFGRAAARALPWYGPGRESALEEELDHVERAIRLWEKSPPALHSAIRCLSQFRDIRGSLEREADNPFDLVELFELKHFLLTLRQFEEALGQLEGFSALPFAPMEEALKLLDPSGRGLPSFAIEDGCHPELAGLRQEKRRIEDELRQASESERPGLLERRRQLAIRERDLEGQVRAELTRQLWPLQKKFRTNMELLGRVDLILAKAKLARKYGCVRPEICAEAQLSLRGLRHPRVAQDLEQEGREFTPVDLDLKRGCTVVTGANMGGKTVLLQAVSLSIQLAQCGFFVFAEAARIPLFDQTALILADNGPGMGGLSSFGTEVHALDAFLKSGGKTFFFLALDEFARGTNPQEGSALAKALVAYLNELGGISLMTTHYDRVSDAAVTHYQVAGLVREVEGDEGEDPRSRIARRMDYRLFPAPLGAPCPRDALRVCRLLELDEKLLELFQGNG